MSTETNSTKASLDCIPDLLGALPDTVWAALTASLITLIGVYLSNRNSRQQLKMQIDRQEEENRRQRQSELRRSVYLQLSETIPRANLLYMELSNGQLDQTKAEDVITELGSTASKIQLIGEPRSAELATQLSNAYAKFWIEALRKSRKVRAIAQEEITQQSIKDEIKAKLHHKLNSFDVATGEEKRQLSEELNAWKIEHENEEKALRLTQRKRGAARKEYLRWAVERLKEPQRLSIALAAELRSELETSADKERLTEIMEANSADIRDTVLKNIGSAASSQA